MPELPEVETTLRGISPTMENRTISEVVVRNSSLRWPVPEEVQQACGRMVRRCWRRAKYLLIELDPLADGAVGGLLIHLGMSGSLRVCEAADAVRKHDHVDVVLDSGKCIRFNDPRRFGVFLWWNEPVQDHRLLKSLGPEPMDGKIVVGVGNIYASEALYMAGIHPTRPAGRISAQRYDALAAAIRDVLGRAIMHGGTTLRDFLDSDGNPGYFAQELLVYEREGLPCFQCQAPIRRKVIGQRSSYYCPKCQR
jgi:formamidopyrimidine-DNA glycosylase